MVGRQKSGRGQQKNEEQKVFVKKREFKRVEVGGILQSKGGTSPHSVTGLVISKKEIFLVKRNFIFIQQAIHIMR